MERILLDSLADRAATEQNRRKAVTQSRGASADPIRHASRAASFTAAGDSSPVGILWHATSGVVSDTGTTGHRHYGRYKNASCGDYLLIASNSPGWRSDSAKVAVRCPVAVASVAVSPASVAVQVGQTVQLAATPQDTGGNPLAGRWVAWASNKRAVAPVTASGLATAVAVGSATITA